MVSSALGFPSKTSAEIAPDHQKSSEAAFGLAREDSAQTRINIALSLHWWYFPAALGNGGNRFPSRHHTCPALKSIGYAVPRPSFLCSLALANFLVVPNFVPARNCDAENTRLMASACGCM